MMHVFVILAVLSSVAYSAIQLPLLLRAVGTDVVFQWNSTNVIATVKWGLVDPKIRIFRKVFMANAEINPTLANDLKARVSFVGNLMAGHAWFKITNLALSDTKDYGVVIQELKQGPPESMQSVHLKVIDVIPRFIKVPPRVLYVQLGEAAIFEWDYISGNKTKILDPLSPRWEVYNSANGWKSIGADVSTLDWQWKLSPSCPERLRNPTRVSKASTANLVLYNVTIADSGIYRCNLTLRHLRPITSMTTLMVTAQPQFTSAPSPIVNVAENKDVQLSCTAVGPPTPNVTWVRVQGVERVMVAQGPGNATLIILNIKRGQKRTYECHAANNPNQKPVSIQTTINVMYPPKIDYSRSDNIITSLSYGSTRLRCAFSGLPIPNITWYSFNGQPIVQNVTSFPGFSELSIKLKNMHASARFMCRAENTLGYTGHNLTIIVNEPKAEQCGKISEKGAIDFVSSPVFVVCIGIIIALIIANVICVCLITKFFHKRRGKSKEREDSFHQGVLNMSTIPDTHSPPLSEHGVSNRSAEERGETVYEQVPEIPAVSEANNTSNSLAGTYQELNVLQQSLHDYQSLEGMRSAVPSRPQCSKSEVENAYEPLRKTNKPHYEQFRRA